MYMYTFDFRIVYSGISLVLVAAMILINLSSPGNLVSLAGIVALLLFSWLISYHKTRVRPCASGSTDLMLN